MTLRPLLVCTVLSSLLVASSGCVSAYKKSVGGDMSQVFTRIYLTDFNTAWQSALDALKHMRLDVSNREAGYIQTKWTNNTSEKNFAESFGSAGSYLKAQYRFRVTIATGSYEGRSSVKVSVTKEQLVQRDVLEGWRPQETDSIEENTLLYRLGRIIFMRMKIAQIEEEKTRNALGDGAGAPQGQGAPDSGHDIPPPPPAPGDAGAEIPPPPAGDANGEIPPPPPN